MPLRPALIMTALALLLGGCATQAGVQTAGGPVARDGTGVIAPAAHRTMAEVPGPAPDEAALAATDGVETPVPGRIAARPGLVMVETDADRAYARRQKMALKASVTQRDRTVGNVVGDP